MDHRFGHDDAPVDRSFSVPERARHLAGRIGNLAALGMSYVLTRTLASYDAHREALHQETILHIQPPESRTVFDASAVNSVTETAALKREG